MTGNRTTSDGTQVRSASRRRVLGAVAGAAGTAAAATPAAAQQAPYGGWFTSSAKGGETSNYGGATVDATGKSSVTVEVGAQGNNGTYAYSPAAVRVDPGTTVTFEWTSDTHNIVVESQPSDADWGGVEEVKNTGHSHEHTFETEGIYKYYCSPHLGLGMKGAIVVGDVDVGEGAAGGTEGDGGLIRRVPGGQAGALVMLSLFGVAAAAVLSVFGTDAWRAYKARPGSEDLGPATEAPERQPVEELGHDEYDPTGTLSLVLVYFLILLVMWTFTYFVEFLGRGPTVIG